MTLAEMKFNRIIYFLALSVGCFAAEESEKTAKIHELFTLQKSAETLERLRLENVALVESRMQGGEYATNPWMIRLRTRVLEKYEAYTKELFSWEDQVPSYAVLYDELYSEEELDGLIAFFSSKAGEAMIRAQPIILRKMQEEAFANAQKGRAVVDKMMKDTVAEIEAELRAEGQIP